MLQYITIIISQQDLELGLFSRSKAQYKPSQQMVQQDSWWAGLFGNPFQVHTHLKQVDVHVEHLAQSYDLMGSLSCRMLLS